MDDDRGRPSTPSGDLPHAGANPQRPSDGATAPLYPWHEPGHEPASTNPPFRARSVVARSLDTLAAGFPVFLALALPAALLSGLLAVVALQGNVELIVLVGLVAAVAGFVAWLLMILVTDAMWSGQELSFARLVGLATPRSIPLVGLYILITAAVMVVIVAIGVLILAMPPVGAIVTVVLFVLGVYAATRLTPLGQVVVIEGVGGIAAIRRSWELTAGHVWWLMRVGILLVLVTLPLSIGSQLLGTLTTIPALAALAPLLATLVTTPLLAISTTIAWAELAGRPHADNELVRRGTGRVPAFTALVGLGVALAAAGLFEGGRTLGANLGAGDVLPVPGVILAGTEANAVDPCRPGNIKATFTVGEAIHIGGYFTRRLPPGEEGRIEVYVNGDLAASESIAAAGPFGTECYYELEPLTGVERSDWQIVVTHRGERIAEGRFAVR